MVNKLKFTWTKFLTSLFLYIILPLFPMREIIICDFGSCNPILNFYPLWKFLLTLGSSYIKIGFDFIFIPIIAPFVIYLITSLFLVDLGRILKGYLENVFSFSKWKFILSFIGWLSIGTILVHFVSGLVGGTTNFDSLQNTLFNFYELFEIILLPVTFVTLFLYKFSVFLSALVLVFFQIPLEVGGFDHPAHLTVFGALAVTIMLFFEWYIVSHLIVSLINKFLKRNTPTSVQVALLLFIVLTSVGFIFPVKTFATPPIAPPCEKISEVQKQEYERIVMSAPEYKTLQSWNIVNKNVGGCLYGAEVPVSIQYLAPKEFSNSSVVYKVSLSVRVSTVDKKIAVDSSYELPSNIRNTINNLEKNGRVHEYINRFNVQYASLENGRALLSNDGSCPTCGRWIGFDYQSGYITSYLLPSDTNYTDFSEINKAVSALEQNNLPLGCKVKKDEHGYTTTQFYEGSDRWYLRVRAEGKDCPIEIGVRITSDGTHTIELYENSIGYTPPEIKQKKSALGTNIFFGYVVVLLSLLIWGSMKIFRKTQSPPKNF